jgi:hypothetical protein
MTATATFGQGHSEWRTWGLRGYGLGFTSFGLFAVAYALRHHHALYIAAKVVAGVVGFTGVALGALSYSYAIRARRVRRREGARWD